MGRTAPGSDDGGRTGDVMDTVTTEAAFQTELARLVRRAREEGVDVRGGYAPARTDRSGWNVEITAVVREEGE